jgi:hypothetical protein
MDDKTHEQELEERLARIDEQMSGFEYGTLSYDAKLLYIAMSTDRQLIVDQLAELRGALPNDRPAYGYQG